LIHPNIPITIRLSNDLGISKHKPSINNLKIIIEGFRDNTGFFLFQIQNAEKAEK